MCAPSASLGKIARSCSASSVSRLAWKSSPHKPKPVFDEIDTVLAGHYGFTAEELDFILNYDIKYRLGRDTETEAED